MTIPTKTEIKQLVLDTAKDCRYRLFHETIFPKKWMFNNSPTGDVTDTTTINESKVEYTWACQGEGAAREWLVKRFNKETGL